MHARTHAHTHARCHRTSSQFQVLSLISSLSSPYVIFFIFLFLHFCFLPSPLSLLVVRFRFRLRSLPTALSPLSPFVSIPSLRPIPPLLSPPFSLFSLTSDVNQSPLPIHPRHTPSPLPFNAREGRRQRPLPHALTLTPFAIRPPYRSETPLPRALWK